MDCLKRPHYLLISESSRINSPGRWRFVLRLAEGEERIVADDVDPHARGDRLELLTVVRGLESLEQPSRVTLWTPSNYVREGIRHGLREWRENGWLWEYFGRMVPVKDVDLWKRLNRALEFHEVDCRSWRIDRAHDHSPTGTRGDTETVFQGAKAVPCRPNPERPRYTQIRRSLDRWRASIRRSLKAIQGTKRLAEELRIS